MRGLGREVLPVEGAWREDQPVWQDRATQYVPALLQRISPDQVPDGIKSLQDVFIRLAVSGRAAFDSWLPISSEWSPQSRVALLRAVARTDHLGTRSPTARSLLLDDPDGLLASVAAEPDPGLARS